MTDAKHEAPAEGAGELMDAAESIHAAAIIYEDQALLDDAEIVLKHLRARSSAPEDREGEAVAGAALAKAMWGIDLKPAAPSADKLREVLRDLMDMEFAKDWRTWSEDRATRLLGIGPRLNAFLAAREAALKAEGA